MEAGKRWLAGDTARAANNEEVTELRREGRDLKRLCKNAVIAAMI